MKRHWILTALISAAFVVGCSSMHDKHHEEEDEEGGEVKMSIDQVPPAVRDTIMQNANGATVKSVDKEMSKSGAVTYETDVMQNGENWEIRVSPDGKLLSKKIDKEEDEKDEHK